MKKELIRAQTSDDVSTPNLLRSKGHKAPLRWDASKAAWRRTTFGRFSFWCKLPGTNKGVGLLIGCWDGVGRGFPGLDLERKADAMNTTG